MKWFLEPRRLWEQNQPNFERCTIEYLITCWIRCSHSKGINFNLIIGRPNIWLGHNNLKHNRKTNSNTRNKFDQIFRALYLLNVYALYLVKVKRNSKQYQRRETTNKSKPKKTSIYFWQFFFHILCANQRNCCNNSVWWEKKRNEIKRWVCTKLMFCSWNMHSFYGLVILLPFYLERCYTHIEHKALAGSFYLCRTEYANDNYAIVHHCTRSPDFSHYFRVNQQFSLSKYFLLLFSFQSQSLLLQRESIFENGLCVCVL